MIKKYLLVCVIWLYFSLCSVAFNNGGRGLRIGISRLYAHHVQKKTIQKIMDRRPKKKRLSDKIRKNVNLNKCITKFDVCLPDYTVVAEEDVPAAIAETQRFWREGCPDAEWIDCPEDQETIMLPRNRDPLPKGGQMKHSPLQRSYPH